MMKFKDVAKEFVKAKSVLVKPSTIALYKLLLSNRILPFFGEMEAEDIAKRHVQQFVRELFADGLAHHTVRDMKSLIGTIMRFASDELELTVTTTFKVQYPTLNLVAKRKELKMYDRSDIDRMFQYHRENPSLKSLGVVVTLCTGMRIGELCGLQWQDVDMKDGTISVNRTVQRIYDIPDFLDGCAKKKSRVIVGSPKTYSSQRTIPIPKWLIRILKSAKGISKDEYYLLSGSDKPIEPRLYRYWYMNFAKDAGVSQVVNFHGLRHTYATQLITNGADVKSVSTLLGHTTVDMTLNVYTHSPMSRRRKIADSIKF